ncbi:MAG: hypothetical protein LBR07_06455 [Puniceicoccales bacterium]|nr:hypothetical protein [Puniceicoccales bacterium]
MPWQFIYTSAPNGLTPGRSGFCAVARDRKMPERLAIALERVSSYEPLSGRPVIFTYRSLSTGAETFGVLTRYCDAGLDYTRRRNALAHHLVFSPAEFRNLPPPAEVALRWTGWRSEWTGQPRWFEEADAPVLNLGEAQTVTPLATWSDLSGDGANGLRLSSGSGGTGGTAVETLLDIADDTSPETALRLFAEASLFVKGGAWSAGFSTGLQHTDVVTQTPWRATGGAAPPANARNILKVRELGPSPDNTPAAGRARRGRVVPPSPGALKPRLHGAPPPALKPPATGANAAGGDAAGASTAGGAANTGAASSLNRQGAVVTMGGAGLPVTPAVNYGNFPGQKPRLRQPNGFGSGGEGDDAGDGAGGNEFGNNTGNGDGNNDGDDDVGSGAKRWAIISAVVLLLLAVAGGGVFAYLQSDHHQSETRAETQPPQKTPVPPPPSPAKKPEKNPASAKKETKQSLGNPPRDGRDGEKQAETATQTDNNKKTTRAETQKSTGTPSAPKPNTQVAENGGASAVTANKDKPNTSPPSGKTTPKRKPPAPPAAVKPVPPPRPPMDPFKIDKEWEKLAGELRKKLQDKNPTVKPICAPIQLLRKQKRDDTVGFPTNLNLGKRPKGGKKVVLVSDEDYEVLKIGVSERAGHKGVFPFFQGKRTILCERPNYSNSMNAEAIAANCEKFANQLDAQIKRITNRKKNAGKSFAKTDAEIGFLTPIRDKAKQRAEALRKPTVNLYSPGRKWYLLSIADGGQSENRNTILVIFE